MTQAQKTDRREFLKKGLSLGLVAGGTVILGKTDFLSAKETVTGMPDLVAVKNGGPDTMFKKAVSLMGGMGQFVKKGQTVVVKPYTQESRPIHRSGKSVPTKERNKQGFPFLNNRQNMIF